MHGPRPGSTLYIVLAAVVVFVFVVGFRLVLAVVNLVTGADATPGPPPAHPPLLLVIAGPLFALGMAIIVSVAGVAIWRAVGGPDKLPRSGF